MKISAITYLDETGKQRIYAFAQGKYGTLHVNYWDGKQWQWADQGQPAGQLRYEVAAISYQEGALQRIYAFTPANDRHLYVNYWDGKQWRWADQGLPSPDSAIHRITSISYQEGGLQRIYVFGLNPGGPLFVNYWDGKQWQWATQGKASNPPQPNYPQNGVAAISYLEGGLQRIYAFVMGYGSPLYVNYWDGKQWRWADQGKPSSGINSWPGVITYQEGGVRRIYAFVVGGDGHLHVNYWDGKQWQWADQGQPSQPLAKMNDFLQDTIQPGVITYLDETGKQRIYAFALGKDAHLHVNYWDGKQWQWADQGTPPGITLSAQELSVITYSDGGVQHIYAFVTGSDFHLHVNYWDGKQWRWADQGQLP